MNIHLQIRENIANFKALTGNSLAYLNKSFNHCSNFLQKCFSYRAEKSWNNLPLTSFNIGNKTVNVLKTLLINH